MNIENSETAIQFEQQSNLKQEIINNIIALLAENNLTISEANEILHMTSKKLCQQTVKVSS